MWAQWALLVLWAVPPSAETTRYFQHRTRWLRR